jgi:hypothetical protein
MSILKGNRGHGYESDIEGIEFIISSIFLRYQEILASDKLMQYLFKDLPSGAWVHNSASTGNVGACNTIIHQTLRLAHFGSSETAILL